MRNLFYLVAFSMFAGGFSSDLRAQENRQIVVVGTGTVTVKPDILRITVGVVAHEVGASDAVRKMGEDLSQVMAALADQGLPPADIQTTGLRLSERYSENRNYDELPKVVGFTASSNVSVIVRDLDRAGEILDHLIGEGANQISGLQFDLNDRMPLVEQARIAAIGDAIAKTALYAQAANVKAGAIMSISETLQSGGFQRGQPMAMAEARSVPLAAGTLDVTAQITVTTAIE